MATCNTEIFAGQGKVFIAPRTKGGAINGAWTELGNSERLEISTNQTWQDVYESCSGNRDRIAHYVTQSEWTFAVDAMSFSKENLARAFYGTSSAVVGASVTAEAVTSYALNAVVPLKNPGVSAVVVKKGATTLTKSTDGTNGDYTLDADNGTITLISVANAGSLPAALTVDYTFAGYDRVDTNVTTAGEFAFRFEGINMTNGKAVIVEIHRVALNLAGALSLISETPAVFTMEGSLLPDAAAGVGQSQYVTIKKAS